MTPSDDRRLDTTLKILISLAVACGLGIVWLGITLYRSQLPQIGPSTIEGRIEEWGEHLIILKENPFPMASTRLLIKNRETIPPENMGIRMRCQAEKAGGLTDTAEGSTESVWLDACVNADGS